MLFFSLTNIHFDNCLEHVSSLFFEILRKYHFARWNFSGSDKIRGKRLDLFLDCLLECSYIQSSLIVLSFR